MRRILVPLDFSGKSRRALDFAIPLARQSKGRIFLLHVVEPVYPLAAFPGEMGIVPAVNPRPELKPSRARLVGLARKLVPPDLLGKALVRSGRAHFEITAAADELKADLIALSTHGHTGLKHVLLGSTAEQVVRHARCPVLTVRRN
jgi:nucleotide-binding universal stress UspA family protein